jgi:hypothetical protein
VPRRPQFVLAGIPTIQVGPNVYEDILVKNKLCAVATSAKELLAALTHPRQETESGKAAILQGLGIHSDWGDRLENVIR